MAPGSGSNELDARRAAITIWPRTGVTTGPHDNMCTPRTRDRRRRGRTDASMGRRNAESSMHPRVRPDRFVLARRSRTAHHADAPGRNKIDRWMRGPGILTRVRQVHRSGRDRISRFSRCSKQCPGGNRNERPQTPATDLRPLFDASSQGRRAPRVTTAAPIASRQLEQRHLGAWRFGGFSTARSGRRPIGVAIDAPSRKRTVTSFTLRDQARGRHAA